MSWGYANSNLFIQCKSEEQAKELENASKKKIRGKTYSIFGREPMIKPAGILI